MNIFPVHDGSGLGEERRHKWAQAQGAIPCLPIVDNLFKGGAIML